MFRRSFAGLPLTPAERTLLKLIKAVVFAVLAFVLGGQGLTVLNQVQAPGANVGAILHDNLLTPVLMIILLTAEKYFTAQGDVKNVPLGNVAVTQTPAGTLSVTAASPNSNPAQATLSAL